MKKTRVLSVPLFVILILISGSTQSAPNDQQTPASQLLLKDYLGASWQYSDLFSNTRNCAPPLQCSPLVLFQQSLTTEVKEPFLKPVDFDFEWSDFLGIESSDVNFIVYPNRKPEVNSDESRVPFRIENAQ